MDRLVAAYDYEMRAWCVVRVRANGLRDFVRYVPRKDAATAGDAVALVLQSDSWGSAVLRAGAL